MIQQIAAAIEAHADGLSMDDENDRRRMAEWIAENFNPKQPMGEGVDSRAELEAKVSSSHGPRPASWPPRKRRAGDY
jgi:hypothetical protein